MPIDLLQHRRDVLAAGAERALWIVERHRMHAVESIISVAN
jgi:hypothetical protein